MWQVVDAIIKAYKEVYGEEKWNSLTVDEQHDAIMIMANDFLKLMEKKV